IASPRSRPTFFRRLVPNTSTTISSTTSQCQRLRPPMRASPVPEGRQDTAAASRPALRQRLDGGRVVLHRLERRRLRRRTRVRGDAGGGLRGGGLRGAGGGGGRA